MFAYELPIIGSNMSKGGNYNTPTNLKTNQPSVIVYNFHSMIEHNRLFIFSQHNHNIFNKKLQNSYYTLNSITELFPAGN
jgi:hypothetical protein